MSELKAFRIIQGDTGGYGAPSYKCDTDGNRLEEWCDICEVYDKSEADKVIDELEESHKKEVEQLLIEIVELKEKHKTEVKELLCLIRDKDNNFNRAFDSEEKELRHQKYKRCLAKANWCEERYNYLTCLENYQMTDKEYKQVIGDYWDRWHKRWLKIADQFKVEAR